MKLKVTMPTKRELLEEKTVKELRQMAREKGLSGYSKMRKDELIDLVEDNYTKAGIEAYSEPAREEAGGLESLLEKLSSNLLVFAVSVVVAAVLIGFTLGYIGIGSEGPTAGRKFVNENYGFSFNYSSGWVVEPRGENSYLVSENVPENQKKGLVQISISNLVQGGPRNINGVEGIELLTSRTLTMGGAPRRINQIILPRNDKIYLAGAASSENEYDNYKSEFDMILDSFTFSKSDLGSTENEDTENYANDNYGIYFNYPSGWILQSSSQEDTFTVFVRDNVSEGAMGAQAFVQVSDVDKASSRNIGGFRGVDFTDTRTRISSLGGTLTIKRRSLLVVKENHAYSVGASAPENVYGGYKSQFDEIIESFTFLK